MNLDFLCLSNNSKARVFSNCFLNYQGLKLLIFALAV
jgi:hypothetical protein